MACNWTICRISRRCVGSELRFPGIVPFATTQASVGLGGAIMDLTGIDAIRAVVTFTDGADETNAVFQLTIGGRVAYRQFP